MANIATGPDPDTTSNPQEFRECNGLTYFTADGFTGRELWRTDRTREGTISLTAVSSPYDHPTPVLYAVDDTCVFFSTTISGSELWRTDGTREGTFALKPGVVVPAFQPTVIVRNGYALFVSAECELWRTDGTQAGTRLITSLCPARIRPGFGTLHEQTFFLREDIFGRSLWTTDGTEVGTRPIAHIMGPARDLYVEAPTFFSLGETLLFLEDEDASYYGRLTYLWRTDGSEAGTFVLGTAKRPAVAAFGSLVFLQQTEELGVEPWITDGTPEGTFVLRDINEGPGGSIVSDGDWFFPAFFSWKDTLLFFVAFDPEHGAEPWRSDGTSAGTYRLADVNPGPNAGVDSDSLAWGQFSFSAAGDTVFFPADDGRRGLELWRADGTEEGTGLLADVYPGDESSYPSAVVGTANGAVFAAAGGRFSAPGYSELDFELWYSDGTSGGTRRLVDIRPGLQSSNISHLAPSEDKAIFVANDGSGAEPWLTDGTGGGTFLLKDLAPTDASSSPDQLIDFDGTLVFSASRDGARTLWRTDRDGAREVVSATHPDGFADARYLARVGDALAFTALAGQERTVFWSDIVTGTPRAVHTFHDVFGSYAWRDRLLLIADDGNGTALWVSDGTPDGTMRLHSIAGRTESFATTRTHAFLSMSNGAFSTLWQTDGTPAGTVLIHDSGDLGPRLNPQIIAIGQQVYYLLHGCRDAQLWSVDGGDHEPRYVTGVPGLNTCDYAPQPVPMAALDDTLILVAWRDDGANDLFRLDGSTLTPVLATAPGWSPPAELTVAGSFLYFVVSSSDVGRELWRTDGTEAGTSVVKDIAPGLNWSSPQNLTAIGDRLLFAADDGETGREAWITCSGTDAARLTDIAPGRAWSDPRSFVASGSQLFFVANDRAHGEELWSAPLAPLSQCTTKDDSSGDGCTITAGETSGAPALLLAVAAALLGWRLLGVPRTTNGRSPPKVALPRAYRLHVQS